MAKNSKKLGDNNVTSKKTPATYDQVPMTNIPKTLSSQPSSVQQSSVSSSASTGTGTLERPSGAGKSHTSPAPSHKQTEDRAKEIWRRKGCPVGQDEQIWLEAEAQLKKEMSTK